MLPVLVGPEAIAEHGDAVVVDVRWYLDGRDGREAYRSGHLPGAVWVDLDTELAAHGGPAVEGRHPLPSPDVFAGAMTRLGVGDETPVIAYDDTGGVTAGRLVVMLRMLGRDAALLDGGLGAWPGPIETGWVEPVRAQPGFTPAPWPAERLAEADETAALAASGGVVLDARTPERFSGAVAIADPRPGHIPGARNASWASVLGADGRFRDPSELREHYRSLGVADAADVITYCGSGVSTCVNVLAMEHAGLGEARIYVASWSGWSADPDRPVQVDA